MKPQLDGSESAAFVGDIEWSQVEQTSHFPAAISSTGTAPSSSSTATPTPEAPDEADRHKGDTSRCRPKTLNQAEEPMPTVRPAGSRHPLLDRTNERTYLLPLK